MESSKILSRQQIHSIVIKKAGTGSCAIVWNRFDYRKEDSTAYDEINYNKKILFQQVGSGSKYFKKRNRSGYIFYKEMSTKKRAI